MQNSTHSKLASSIDPFLLAILGSVLFLSVNRFPVAGDPAELTLTSLKLGVAHPSGYPLYVLLGFLNSKLLFFLEPGFAFNLFSAACLFISSFLMLKVLQILEVSPLARAAATTTWVATPEIFRYGTFAEVYSLHALLVLSILYSLLYAIKWSSDVARYSAAALCGIAIGNHMTIVLLFPAFLLLFMHSHFKEHSIRKLQLYLVPLSLCLLGSCIIFVPIIFDTLGHDHYLDRFLEEFPNFVSTDLWSRWWWMVSAKQYHIHMNFAELFSMLGLAGIYRGILTLWDQNYILSIGGLSGIIVCFILKKYRVYALSFSLAIACQLVYFSTYAAFEPVFLIPGFTILAIATAIFLDKLNSYPGIKKISLTIILLISLGNLYQLGILHYHSAFIKSEQQMQIERFLKRAPRDSVLFADWPVGTLARLLQHTEDIGAEKRIVVAAPYNWQRLRQAFSSQSSKLFFDQPLPSEFGLNCKPKFKMYYCP